MTNQLDTPQTSAPRLTIVQLARPEYVTGTFVGPGTQLIAAINPASIDWTKSMEPGSGAGKRSNTAVTTKTTTTVWASAPPTADFVDSFAVHSFQLRYSFGLQSFGGLGITPYHKALAMLKEWASKLPRIPQAGATQPPRPAGLKVFFASTEETYMIYGHMIEAKASITRVRPMGQGSGESWAATDGTIECTVLEIPQLQQDDVG